MVQQPEGSASGGPAARQMTRPRLVGREHELTQLLELVEISRAGSGGVVVLRGEAGIGKTRLLAEMLDGAAAGGAAVYAGEARQLEMGRPFGAVCDAFGVTAAAADVQLRGLFEKLKRPPAHGQVLEVMPVEVHYLVEEFVGVFETLSSGGPLVLAIDNVQWADGSTLTLLQRLARICSQYPALIAVTTRPTGRPEVLSFCASVVHGGGALLELGALDGPSVSSIAAEVTGAPPGPRLVSALDKAAGNPLFVIELLAALLQQDKVSIVKTERAELDESPATVSLDAVILHRLDLLSEETVELLHAAAVLGPVIDIHELGLLTGRGPLELAAPLREATRAGIVRPNGDRLEFRHEVVHEALYADWPPPVRKAMHRTLGRRLAESGAPAARVAHHLGLGAETGDGEAVGWLHRAGLEAAPRTPQAAAQMLARAVELAPPGVGRDVVRTDLAVALGWAGQVTEGEHVARSVVEETPDSELRGRAASWLASSLLTRGRVQDVHDVCAEALAAGVASERSRILLRLNQAVAAIPLRIGAAKTAMENLLRDARRLGEDELCCLCLVGLEMAEANAGRLGAAAAYGAEAVGIAERLAPAEMAAAPAHIVYAWVLEEQDLLDHALGTITRLRRLIGPLPRSAPSALHDQSTARVHLAAGRWDDALVDLDSALTFEFEGAGAWADALALRAGIAVHRGMIRQATKDLARVDAELAAGQSCWNIEQYFLARAFLLEGRGRVGEAAAVLRAAWELADAVPLTMVKSKVGPHLAAWSRASGDVGTARDVAEGLAALANANPGVVRLQAAALWAQGHADDDADALLEAVELQRGGCRPFELGLVSEDAAAAVAASGRTDAARALLVEALTCYDAVAALQRSASARRRLRAAGVRAGSRAVGRRPRKGWEALTASEMRVAELVAERLSNPQIAERLGVSRRTVEAHVSRALAKLECSSRQQLADTWNSGSADEVPARRTGAGR